MLKMLFLTTLISTHFAQASIPDCQGSLVKHLKEAIDHNQKFAIIYSDMTLDKDGIQSISHSLINMERLSVLFLRPLDKLAIPYQEKMIPVMCENVVSMEGARTSTELLPQELRPTEFHEINIKDISKVLKKLFKNKNYEEAYRFISQNLEELENYPEQLCLTRHFLESMARSIYLLQNHKQLSSENSLQDPSFITEKFLELQRKPLKFNYSLDKRAFPFQKEGISIICNDVPFIPWK